LTAKYFYYICYPYTDGYFRSQLYDFSHFDCFRSINFNI